MFGVLYSDIFSLIAANSDPIDIYRVKCIDKYHYKYISNDFIHGVIIKNITQKLKQTLGCNYDNFMMIMEKYKIRISGSFIIQCALGEYWNDSDIDLYTYSQISTNFFDWTKGDTLFMRDNYNNLPNIDTIINFYVRPESNKSKDNYYVKSIRRTPTYKLQLIMLDKSIKNPNISSYVNMHDFNICKNVYKIKNGKHVLKINNLNNIMQKQIQPDANIGRDHVARWNKYLNRGFTFQKIRQNYITYINRIVPIIFCDVHDEKMSNIYFLGKHMKTSKWRNDNITIKYFSRDMYSRAHICHHSGVGHSYDKKGNFLIETGNNFSLLRGCVVDDYYDNMLYEHRHATMIVRKKQTNEEFYCEVIIMKRKHPEIKNNYELSTDTYAWLDMRSGRRCDRIHLFDNREKSFDRYFND